MGQIEYVSQSHKEALKAVGNILKTQMADFLKAHVDQKRKLLQKQPKPKPARKMINTAAKSTNKVMDDHDERMAKNADEAQEDGDNRELIQEEQHEVNMENINKEIFELSALI